MDEKEHFRRDKASNLPPAGAHIVHQSRWRHDGWNAGHHFLDESPLLEFHQPFQIGLIEGDRSYTLVDAAVRIVEDTSYRDSNRVWVGVRL